MSNRQRHRLWAFTCDLSDDRIWDPATICWDETSCKYICCGLEEGGKNNRLHWQGFIALRRAVDLQPLKKQLCCEWIHLEACKGTAAANYNYVTKSDTGVSYDDDTDTGGQKIIFEWGDRPDISKKISKDEAYRQMLGEPDFESAMKKIEELAPKDFVVYQTQIKNILIQRFLSTPLYIREMTSFIRPPVNWIHCGRMLSVCLLGLSGTGKTAYALAHFTNPKMITHVDDLKAVLPSHDGLVFDDIGFHHWPPEACINIVDCEYERSIHLRHNNARIKKNMPRFFCSNLDMPQLFNMGDPYGQHAVAIKRRCMVINIHKNLF